VLLLLIAKKIEEMGINCPEVAVPAFALIQKTHNRFHMYVDDDSTRIADTFMQHLTTLMGFDVCMRDEHDWVKKAVIGGHEIGGQVEDASPMKETFVVMGLETHHTDAALIHVLTTVDERMPDDIQVSVPRGIAIHASVWKLNGGKGAVCVQVPKNTSDNAKRFAKLVDGMKFIQYGQARLFIFSTTMAVAGIPGAEPPPPAPTQPFCGIETSTWASVADSPGPPRSNQTQGGRGSWSTSPKISSAGQGSGPTFTPFKNPPHGK
jgi:hypothetical protein